MSLFQDSWDNAFKQYNSDPTDFAGGTVQMVNGYAHYTDPTGEKFHYGRNADPNIVIQNNPEIGEEWTKQFGSDYLGSTPTTSDSYLDMFQPDLYPSSSSASASASNSNSSSRSGIWSKYLEQIMSAVTPSLVSSVTNLPGQVDSYANNALEMGNAASREAMKYAGDNVLESLAQRGLMDSSLTGSAMGTALGDVAKNTQNLGYQTGMDKAEMQLSIPQILAQIAQLGNVSESSGTSTSSSGSTSESSQPNVPWENAMNFMLGMMPS